MIKIFMDESGTHEGSPVVTVAAYAGRPRQWENFTRKWNHAKGRLRVFHAADCQALQGEFKGWSPEDRNALVIRLMAILRDGPFPGQAVGINLRDYDAALAGKDHLKKLFGSTYATCFHWTVANIMEVVEKYPTNERLAFFHEQNEFHKEAIEAFNWIEKNRVRHKGPMSLTFAGKDDFVPLQAADVLAYEANKKLRNPTGSNRRSLEALDPSKERISIKAYTKHNMDWLVRRLESMHEEIKVFGRVVTFLPPAPSSGTGKSS